MKLIKTEEISNHIDEGVYIAVIKELTEGKGKRGNFLIWNFKVKEPMLDGEAVDHDVFVSGVTPVQLSENGKLDEWLQAAGMTTGAVGAEFDTEDLHGVVVKVWVEDNNKDGKTYSKVVKITKAKKVAKAPTTTTDEPQTPAPKSTTTEKKADNPKTPAAPVEKPATKAAAPKEEDEELFDFK